MSEQLSVSKTVDASPEQVFAVLSDPGQHAAVDGSAMLRGIEGASSISKVGDTFVMNMYNDILGDYQMVNTVSAFEPNRVIAWAPTLNQPEKHKDKLGDIKAGGHTFTWELEPAGGGTKVTQTYDWSAVPDPNFKGMCPLISEEQLSETIDKVADAAK